MRILISSLAFSVVGLSPATLPEPSPPPPWHSFPDVEGEGEKEKEVDCKSKGKRARQADKFRGNKRGRKNVEVEQSASIPALRKGGLCSGLKRVARGFSYLITWRDCQCVQLLCPPHTIRYWLFYWTKPCRVALACRRTLHPYNLSFHRLLKVLFRNLATRR